MYQAYSQFTVSLRFAFCMILTFCVGFCPVIIFSASKSLLPIGALIDTVMVKNWAGEWRQERPFLLLFSAITGRVGVPITFWDDLTDIDLDFSLWLSLYISSSPRLSLISWSSHERCWQKNLYPFSR